MSVYNNAATGVESSGLILETSPGVQASIVGNPLLAALPGGSGVRMTAANAPTALTTLTTVAMNANRIGFYVQNQSAATIQIAFGSHDQQQHHHSGGSRQRRRTRKAAIGPWRRRVFVTPAKS